MARHSNRRARKPNGDAPPASVRSVDYHNLVNPFTPQAVFSEDHVEALHQNALKVLEELGIKVLLPEARQTLREAGALVDEETQMVRIGREIVVEALSKAPESFEVLAGSREKDLIVGPGRLIFKSGAGCPHAFDRERGRRPGNLRDFEELIKLTESFDALQWLGAIVEPQDIAIHERHYRTMQIQLSLSHKVPWVFARGQDQVFDCFEMIRIVRGVSREQFTEVPYCTTVVNTNSPRQLDKPMARGIIDFAREGQLCIITPFCLLGAMAPITVAGALSLQHAETLAGVTLSQLTRPGAPVLYGNFASNVDMRSGSPTFGTPEQIKATLGSGQLARHVGLPWRSSSGSGSNIADAQGAHETEMSAWAAVLGGANAIMHSAGWLEGGLTLGYEKLITDMEMVQTFAEVCAGADADDAELAFDAIADVTPGGHFFATQHTMDRYRTAFYEPLVADSSNYGQWQEAGSLTADQRATSIWKSRLDTFVAPTMNPARLEQLDDFIARRISEGGAAPMS
ncbi:MAG: trimethylamine methyltransferase family protein [Gammaproteobacteria bacterium]|jgi:trimethylamine--corrinoid protein Co-methyltransferase